MLDALSRHLRVGAVVVAAMSGVFSVEAARLVSGPMLGHRAHREVTLWLETEGASAVRVDYWRAGQPEEVKSVLFDNPGQTPAGGQVIQARLGLLEMGTSYQYSISIDGAPVALPHPLTFSTTDQWEWRRPPPDFSFLLGSCAYINDPPYDRPGTPYGGSTAIFRHMAETGADFMLWMGDNWYYREADYSSVSGLWYRARHDRSIPDLQPLLARMHHYATWDDHDYGPNDSDKSFEFKDTTLDIFKTYWANPSYGEPGNSGVHHKFYWSDAVFLLMDNRYHRDNTLLSAALHPSKTQYGARQLEWLKQSLLEAKRLRHYTFKFIVTGGQVLTSFGAPSETFALYPNERADLLRFIRDHDITGVVFLSGDVHFTELTRSTMEGRLFYEITSSPLTAGPWTAVDQSARGSDPMRVAGTLVNERNFCQVRVQGPPDARVLDVSCHDGMGALRWRHEIAASELR